MRNLARVLKAAFALYEVHGCDASISGRDISEVPICTGS